MSTEDLNSTDDAAVWAVEMARVFRDVEGVEMDPEPGGLLHAWLCNAIETGRGFGYSQAMHADEQRRRNYREAIGLDRPSSPAGESPR